ncbi:putative ribonuclease H protein [Sesamum angolense]|uniref:Ribonuclease H protein n=1 Tax=Sesamum angolense TaxID=2727404 RepID=A0AAE1WGK8_9LAMI|nr:putative ribonuclease H protein [Sesamum angolense]
MTNLSHGGRLALIRSVLQATPLHLLQVIHPPKSVLITIERIFNGFFWGSYNGRKHIHWYSWAKVYFPVAEGGLGVHSLADYVRAFYMKLWWRFRGKSSLWSEYLHGRYYQNLHPTIVPYNHNHSSIWHRLCRIPDVAEPFILWTLGEGSVSFWHDNWFGKKPLAQLLHRDTYTMESNPSGRANATQRNATKYRGVSFSTDGIILEVQRHLCTLYAARTLTSTQWKGYLHQAAIMGFIFRQQVPQAPSIMRWHASSPSWFKLNTDGSSLGNPGLAGAAGIIRDSAGHVHLAYQFALGTGISVLAELTAVWRGMELTLTHDLAPFVVEVDATTVISLLKSRAFGKWDVQHLIMRFVCLQQLLVADVQHVFREANGAVDHLAKEAASLQLTRVLHHDDITGILRGILCLDRQGAPHLRRG